MLLQELIGVKQFANKRLSDSFYKLVNKYGIKAFRGAYGIVIVPEHRDYVYKVWVDDPGYEAYIKMVMKNQDNPFLPKVFGDIVELNLPTKNRDTIKVVRVEKLVNKSSSTYATELAVLLRFGLIGAKMGYSNAEKGINKKLEVLAAAYERYVNDVKTGNTPYGRTDVSEIEIEIEQMLELFKERRETAAAYKSIMKMDKDKLIDSLLRIREAITMLEDRDIDAFHDINPANYMFRKDGHLVITDPISTSISLQI